MEPSGDAVFVAPQGTVPTASTKRACRISTPFRTAGMTAGRAYWRSTCWRSMATTFATSRSSSGRNGFASFWRGAMMAVNSSSICKATVQRYSRTLVALAWKASFLSVQILPTEQDRRGCGSRSKTVITRPLSGSRPLSRRENFGGGNSHRLHEPSARKQHRVSSQKAHTAPAEVLKTGVTGEREIERVNVGDDTKLPPTPWPGLWSREVVLGRGGMRAAVIIATGLGLALLQPRPGSTAY